MQDLILQGLQQKLQKSCFRCNKNTCTSNQAMYYNLQNICFSSLIDLDIVREPADVYITSRVQKFESWDVLTAYCRYLNGDS